MRTMKKSFILFTPILLTATCAAVGQSLESVLQPQTQAPSHQTPTQPAPSQTTQITPARQNLQGSKFLGGDIPVFDPSSETISWDGRVWNVNNNRVFQARFEKYLNAPEETSEADQKYNQIIDKILSLLAPRKVSPRSLDEAFRLLTQASEFSIDSQLCDAIANQVHSAWQAKKERDRLAAANNALESERKRLEWNMRVAAQPSSLSGSAPRDPAARELLMQQQQQARDAQLAPIVKRIAEVEALTKKNDLRREISEAQARIEFQALILQMFLQRRFRHVLIATRFYRAIFTDGDTKLELGEDAKSFFSKTTGSTPTVSILDSIAGETIRDVAEGIESFKFLLNKNELDSATKRLAETFIVGEYMPEVRTLPRKDKRRILEFTQLGNRLTSALEVRDFTKAETILNEMEKIAPDFDGSKARTAIETARTVASMHIAKAKNAASAGDRTTLEAELRAAAEIWPRNPALAEVSQMIFSHSDTLQRTLIDFDQLLAQKNYRQIYDDRMRFIAAAAMDPQREKQLAEVLERMATIEAAILKAQEIEKRGDPAGAWESAERAYLTFSDDSKLNQIRADLTTRAPDFVGAIRTAQELESKKQIGSSLAWYLRAKQIYPPSEFASEGIDRLIRSLLPDAR